MSTEPIDEHVGGHGGRRERDGDHGGDVGDERIVVQIDGSCEVCARFGTYAARKGVVVEAGGEELHAMTLRHRGEVLEGYRAVMAVLVAGDGASRVGGVRRGVYAIFTRQPFATVGSFVYRSFAKHRHLVSRTIGVIAEVVNRVSGGSSRRT